MRMNNNYDNSLRFHDSIDLTTIYVHDEEYKTVLAGWTEQTESH